MLVRVLIVSDTNGNPIEGAKAETWNEGNGVLYTKFSDATGRVSIGGQPNDRLTISHPNFGKQNYRLKSVRPKIILEKFTMHKTFVIKNIDGQPVKNAHVRTSTTNGAVTNANGVATLSVELQDTVTISHLSYATVTKTIGENTPDQLNITLQTKINELPDVVIGKKKKTVWLKPIGIGLAFLLLVATANKPKKIAL
ncbi:carboxypeptidase regulatory-like domain-containing protein [Zunongwangia sp.]|uniref:carboxypeptidase regulatory-like domain-containing protein n=1 Tax=Zunongwangia sp. TaxID=1965325 RepID=UPI003AA949DC